jgi:tRNA uridine 5-carboxymethylaminomethyl modification enzyme
MSSRAEYRLLLRHDNADLRLTKHGHDIGLISDERYQAFLNKYQKIAEAIDILAKRMSRARTRSTPIFFRRAIATPMKATKASIF